MGRQERALGSESLLPAAPKAQTARLGARELHQPCHFSEKENEA